MNRALAPLALLLSLTLLAGCKKEEPPPPPPPELVAPATADDGEWKAYLGKVVGQNMAGVTDRNFSYYLPADSQVLNEGDADGRTQFDRQLENVTTVVLRTVLPGNMLSFGSPDSEKMADLIVMSFQDAEPDALAGSQVLFIGKAEDSERVRVAVEAAGAKYLFIEAK